MTPAVSENSLLQQSSFYTLVYNGSTYGPYPGPNTPLQKASRYRPESINNPKMENNLRKPGPWYHSNERFRYGSLGLKWNIPGGYYLDANGMDFSYGNYNLPSYDDRLWEDAVNGALEKLKSQDVNLGTMFGERIATANTFADIVTGIAGKYRDFRRSKGKIFERVKRLIPGRDTVPDEWLKLQYGILPALGELDGVCRELSGLEEGRQGAGYYIRVSCRSYIEDSGAQETGDLMRLVAQPLMASVTKREDCKVVLFYAIDNEVVVAFSELGVTNVASVAFELLPYSFVLDWALPVGNWINLLDADFGWRYLSGSATRVMKRRTKGQYWVLPAGVEHYNGSPSNVSVDQFKMDRSVFDSSPYPVFPSIRNPFSSSNGPTRVANATSLLAQVLR